MSRLRDSFARARVGGFAVRFYDVFLPRDPRFKALFAKTDLDGQRQLLEHGIFALLDFAEGKALGHIAVDRLGRSHHSKKLRVTSDMYPIWIDCVIHTLTELDGEFSSSLATEWRSALQKGIDVMIATSAKMASGPTE